MTTPDGDWPAAPYAAPYVPPPDAPQWTVGPTRVRAAAAGTFVRGLARRARTEAAVAERVHRGRAAGAQRLRQVAPRVDPARLTATAGRVGRGTAEHTGRAVRHTVTAFAEFGIGIAMFWRGLWTFVRSPRLWVYALVPAVVLYLLMLSSPALVRVVSYEGAEWLAGFADDWPDLVRWMLLLTFKWALKALLTAIVGFLVVPVTLLVGAPFYVLTVRSLERRLGEPARTPRPNWLEASAFVMSQTAIVFLVVAFGGLLMVPVLLIPGVNLLAAVAVAVVINGFVVGLLAVGLPLHHRGVCRRRSQLGYAWRRRWAVIGFGGMSVLVLSVPYAPLRWLTVPAVFVGAVLLHRRLPYVSASSGPGSTGSPDPAGAARAGVDRSRWPSRWT
ncbi:EI24 domain-containing protein [Virgisporangium aurantiacum]|uniref:CysZ protein n=1 Tax=Virgisporangium aurantiacum TaxID=175570 RepID=A0A8J4E121_9ACTN|nr:EI24 domain-containing protein [Virgisporangium aurantiacum]GIJ57549.1 hypothetical protein Vau01_050650 [Virgisporangium aurantiacum]